MHSLYQRLSNASALLSTCMMCLLGAITLSSLLFPTSVQPGSLSLRSINVHKGLKMYTSGLRKHIDTEFAYPKLDISADLTSLFDWNTKQLFLYVDAEFTSADGTTNTVVVWDMIVRRKEDANVKAISIAKYPIKDIAKSLKNSSAANYTLRYNLMPYVGVLTYGEAGRMTEPVEFPLVKKLA